MFQRSILRLSSFSCASRSRRNTILRSRNSMGSWRVNIAQHGTTTIAQAATGFSGVLTSPIERLNQPTNINRPQSNEIKTYQNNIHQYPTNIHTHTQNGYIMLHLPDLHMNGGLWMNRPKESKPAASWFSYVMLQQE